MKRRKEGDGPEKFVVRLDETGYLEHVLGIPSLSNARLE
jgi:hypothetical protein